jgi:hypothetical protein
VRAGVRTTAAREQARADRDARGRERRPGDADPPEALAAAGLLDHGRVEIFNQRLLTVCVAAGEGPRKDIESAAQASVPHRVPASTACKGRALTEVMDVGLWLLRVEVGDDGEHSSVVVWGLRKVQRAEDVPDVLLDGVLGDEQLVGDRMV